jgi:hypothetical protein
LNELLAVAIRLGESDMKGVKMPMTKDLTLVALLAFAALTLAGTMDSQDAEDSHREYCGMVALWDADASQGVAPEHRAGWPPFGGSNKCK